MPLFGTTMDRRNEVFQRLKPPCVALSQVALTLSAARGDTSQLIARLEDVQKTLKSVASRPASLDSKLADYVFFPLSQVLKVSQRVPIRALELALQCLAIILEHGWRSQMQPQLAAQIVILCTVMAEENTKGLSSAQTTDELRTSALDCLRHVFEFAAGSSELRDAMTAEPNVPQLGQTMSTILDNLVGARSIETQVAASRALQALVTRVATIDIQAAFLPGIVSKLTKLLTPKTAQRRNHEVLVRALEILAHLFKATLGDEATASLSEDQYSASRVRLSNVVDQKWLETAASQLKPAITNILKVRETERNDVKESLAQFCLTVMHCRRTLEDSASMCLETLLILCSEQSNSIIITSQVELLVSQDASVLALLQTTLHDWISSLPTKMQAADESAKVERIGQISTAYDILVTSGTDTTVVDKMLVDILRDSVAVTLQPPRLARKEADIRPPVQSMELNVHDRKSNTEFLTPLVKYRAQEEVMQTIEKLANSVSRHSYKIFSGELARALRQSLRETQIATFWLLLNTTQTALEQGTGVDEFLVMDNGMHSIASERLDDLYAFSLDILTDNSEDVADPRLQALALRSLALFCRTSGQEFRHELIDALYPILHSLATPDTLLQQDSMTTLNIFASSCGYESVENLIVENVDYLTNAVSLRLNAFDVSPQAPQVLLMMVQLAGPSLLPYLDDTVDSLFAALQDYHGYPLLVELIFRVLSVVAEQGTKAPQLAITDGTKQDLARYYEDRWQPVTIACLAALLREKVAEEEQIAAAEKKETERHPKRPWKSTDENGSEEEGSAEDDQRGVDIPDPPPPAPKTYGLLLRISELTQHFLPSASASLRSSLLNLIKTTTPAISRHENSFLPLVNTLWPEVVSRLDDTEPYVVATALDLIAMLCEHAGGFMRTRIQQLWPELQEMYNKTAANIVQSVQPQSHGTGKVKDQHTTAMVHSNTALSLALMRIKATPADYSDTSTRLLWASLLGAITSIAKRISLAPEMFDNAVEMLAPVLDDEETRAALEAENADAVWLVMLRGGKVSPPTPPRDDTIDWTFVQVAG
ncbi:hypothetical protein CBER1_07062 [Cercospora berteroae]|uniref:Uncharacterized protein n=1 Tax=Cercospora berteroae TaxID=357750 RepID=A0A2S6C707_9PEZI|nr:hypothetical protein CBER1_07062 [Cercospora berteroae]